MGVRGGLFGRLSQAGTPFTGLVRVAVLPRPGDEESEALLKNHAHAFPRGGKVSLSVDGDQMHMRRANPTNKTRRTESNRIIAF